MPEIDFHNKNLIISSLFGFNQTTEGSFADIKINLGRPLPDILLLYLTLVAKAPVQKFSWTQYLIKFLCFWVNFYKCHVFT